jgi:hypothetical protein
MNDQSHDDNNWLHAAIISCPQCQNHLYRVDHSPFYDSYFLYCDTCANRVEVDLYDPIFVAITNQLTELGQMNYATRMAAIEERLQPCSCGGNFRHNTARRCHICFALVLDGELDVDLWPATYGINVDEREPTDEETAQAEAFDAQHVRREHIWR